MRIFGIHSYIGPSPWLAAVSSSFLCAVMVNALLAQTAKIGKANHQKGVLTGRVFAITKSGDLKPARIAGVHIFFYGGDDSAGDLYMKETNQATEALTAEMSQSGSTWSERQTCLRDLHIYEPILVEILDWVQSKKKYDQVINLHTDEDGFFTTVLPPGPYIITVRGRAGANEALWDTSLSDIVRIKPGSRVDVKLSSPSKSCVDSSN